MVVEYHHRSVVGVARAPVSLNLLQSLKLEVWNENLSYRTKDTKIDDNKKCDHKGARALDLSL